MDEYFQNSLARESEEMDRIRAAVREAGIFVVLGYSERHRGSLYISQVRRPSHPGPPPRATFGSTSPIQPNHH